MGKNIFMTDLKLENTLYDTDLGKGILIDVGNSLEVEV